jgi:hypothetical protein
MRKFRRQPAAENRAREGDVLLAKRHHRSGQPVPRDPLVHQYRKVDVYSH